MRGPRGSHDAKAPGPRTHNPVMKPPAFSYVRPASAGEAVAALAVPEAMALAGGQTMIGLLNQRRVRPALVVDLTGIAELTTVRREDGCVVAGAMVTLEQAARDPILVAAAPLLADATAHVASPQIRARSTLGGSVAHADPVGEALTALIALRAQAVVAAADTERTAAVEDL